MPLLSCLEVIEASCGELINGSIDEVFSGLSTDSRKIKPGELFIPIVGERFDGHSYIGDALRAGARGSLTQKDYFPKDKEVIIKVNNTITALGEIACYHRLKFDLPVVAVTGSVGKTSTKDMIACVLSKGYSVLGTEGNYNNEIGLPLTLLNLDTRCNAAVVEMGMSGLNEISRLTKLARPHVAVITNIGLSHIGMLGSRENILKAKLEVLGGLDGNGLVFLNADDELLIALKGKLPYRTIFYGTSDDADYRAYDIKPGEEGIVFKTRLKGQQYEIILNVQGRHNAINAMAAVAVGIEMGIAPESIIDGLSMFRSGSLRLEITETNGVKIINDTYNACPESMKSALHILAETKASRRMAVLGDMLELGEWAQNAHYEVGMFAAGLGLDYIIAVGENARDIVTGAREAGTQAEVLTFHKVEDAVGFIPELVREGDSILIKGSRGMRMERIADELAKAVEI